MKVSDFPTSATAPAFIIARDPCTREPGLSGLATLDRVGRDCEPDSLVEKQFAPIKAPLSRREYGRV